MREKHEIFGMAAISTGASAATTAGHFYWHYLGIIRNQQVPPDVDFRLVAGPAISGAKVTQFFSDKAHENRFRLNPLTPFRHGLYRARRVFSSLEAQGIRAFYFYEGSLADLALALYLAPRFPNSVFLFNFFWPSDWRRVLTSGTRGVGLPGLLRKRPPNILFTADTPVFAEFMSEQLRLTVPPFPSFSPIEFSAETRSNKRVFDVLVTCKRFEELSFGLDVLSALPFASEINVALHLPESLSRRLPELDASRKLQSTEFGNELSTSDYLDLLSSSKLVFLCYLKTIYDLASSGKALDAYQANCKLFIPEGSAIESQVKRLVDPVWSTFPQGQLVESSKRLKALIQKPAGKTLPERGFSGFVGYMQRIQDEHGKILVPDSRRDRARDYLWLGVLARGMSFSFSERVSWLMSAKRLYSVVDQIKAWTGFFRGKQT